MGIRGIDTKEYKYTPLGAVLRDAKFKHADRTPALPRGLDWTKGPCGTCGKDVTVVKRTRQCGACYIKERNG
jgi:hypothetical protein